MFRRIRLLRHFSFLILVAGVAGLAGCAPSTQNAYQQLPSNEPSSLTRPVPADETGKSNQAQRHTYGGGETVPYESGEGVTSTTGAAVQTEDNSASNRKTAD